jgi:hypothetical protein
MSDQDALGADMHPLLGSLEGGPSAGDQDTLERLLDGRLDPGSVPPGYGGLARLLAAATAPAAPDELAGERLAMATFAAVRPHPPTHVPRRAAMAGKAFTAKAAAAALVAVLSVGGIAAAATGRLPGQASPVADRAAATTAGAAARGLGRAAVTSVGGTAQPRAGDGQGRESAVGPDATAAARVGLCQAWESGQGDDQGRRMDAVAFQALVAAAGGVGKVAGYCKDAAAGASTNGHAKGQAPPPGNGRPANPGPPASTGPGGHGQGGPPTTG